MVGSLPVLVSTVILKFLMIRPLLQSILLETEWKTDGEIRKVIINIVMNFLCSLTKLSQEILISTSYLCHISHLIYRQFQMCLMPYKIIIVEGI